MYRLICTVFVLIVSSGIQAFSSEYKTEYDGTKWKLFNLYGYSGVKNEKGKIIIPAKYTSIKYEDESFTVKDNIGRVGKYTKKGKLIFPIYKYITVTAIKGVKESPFIVSSEEYGVLNRKGEVLLADIYTRIDPIVDNEYGSYFKIYKDGYMGIADFKGNIIIATGKYSYIERYVGDDKKVYYIYRIRGGGSGVCDKGGKEIIHTKYFTTKPRWDGNNIFYEVMDGNNLGTINQNGDFIKPIGMRFDQQYFIMEANNMQFSVWRDKNNKVFVKNALGKTIIPPLYDDINVTNNHFIVKEKQYMGLISTEGRVIIPTSERKISIGQMDNYIFATDSSGKTSIILYNGRTIFPAIHRRVYMHLAKIKTESDTLIYFCDSRNNWGIKDLKGNTLLQPIWDDFGCLKTKFGFYFTVYKGGKVGLHDADGNLILAPEYNKIKASTDKNNPFFFLWSSNYIGIADKDGNILINPEVFENISFSPKTKQFTASVGKRICKFNQSGKLLSDNQRQIQKEEYLSNADNAFSKGKYKQAAEFYGRALALAPDASLYFNRGVSYYNMNKYYEAISDFKNALDSRPSDRIKDRALDLIEKAEYYQEQKEIRQMQLGQAIFGLAMTGISYALQPKKKSTNNSSYYSASSSSSSSGSSSSETDAPSTSKKGKQKCGFCGGKGSTIEYVANYGIDNQPWCDECGKKVTSGHYHKKCSHCNGTGER